MEPTDPEAHYGPVVTPEHKARVEQWIDTAEQEGAEVVIDGRGFTLQGEGFVGPTPLDRVTTDMESYKEEIFGPVLQVVRGFRGGRAPAERAPVRKRRRDLHAHGYAAREFAHRVNVGMVDQRADSVPVSYHSFGGWKRSGFGDTDQYGQEGLKFLTKAKKVTQRGQMVAVTIERLRHPDDGVRRPAVRERRHERITAPRHRAAGHAACRVFGRVG